MNTIRKIVVRIRAKFYTLVGKFNNWKLRTFGDDSEET